MDWVVAFLLGVIVIGLIFVLPIVVTVLSVLLIPVLLFGVVTLVIWLLLQILREDTDSENGKGPEP